MAGASVKFERAVMDVRWADFAGALRFAFGKGAARARVDVAVIKQAGWNCGSAEFNASLPSRARFAQSSYGGFRACLPAQRLPAAVQFILLVGLQATTRSTNAQTEKKDAK